MKLKASYTNIFNRISLCMEQTQSINLEYINLVLLHAIYITFFFIIIYCKSRHSLKNVQQMAMKTDFGHYSEKTHRRKVTKQ